MAKFRCYKWGHCVMLPSCRFRAKPAQGQLDSLNILNGHSLNLMKGIFKSLNFKKLAKQHQKTKTKPNPLTKHTHKKIPPSPKQLISHIPKYNTGLVFVNFSIQHSLKMGITLQRKNVNDLLQTCFLFCFGLTISILFIPLTENAE